MGKRIVIPILIAALAALAAMSTTAAGKILVVTKADSSITLNASPLFSGKVKSEEPLCRSGRQVRIYNAATGVRIAKTKTNSNGEYSKPSTFAGGVFAKVTRKRLSGSELPDFEDGIEGGEDVLVCKKALTAAPGAADLALLKTFGSSDCEGTCLYSFQFTVVNNGPGTAIAAAVTEILPAGWTFVNSSIPCSDNGNGTYSCALGNLAPGQVVQFNMTLQTSQGTNCSTNNASVASSTPDPNLANNADDASAPC